jgi:hypothetical protein
VLLSFLVFVLVTVFIYIENERSFCGNQLTSRLQSVELSVCYVIVKDLMFLERGVLWVQPRHAIFWYPVRKSVKS